MTAEESSTSSYRQGSDVFILSGPARDAMRALRSERTIADDALPTSIIDELESEGVRLARGCGRIALAEPAVYVGN